MNISPHKERVYISCLDGKIYAYHLVNPTPEPVGVYYGHRPNTYYAKACLSTCGSYLLSGSSDDHAYIWLTDSPGCPVASLAGHCDEVTSVAWNTDTVVTCSDDMRHRIFKFHVIDKGDEETWRTLQGFAIPYQKCVANKHPLSDNIRSQFNTGKCWTHNVSHSATELQSASTMDDGSTQVLDDVLQSDMCLRVMSTPSQARLKMRRQVTPKTTERKTLLSWLSSSKKTPISNKKSLTRNSEFSETSKGYSKRKLVDLLESNQENMNNEDKKPALSPSKNILSERENQQGPNMVAKMLKYDVVSAADSKSDSEFDGLKLMDEVNKTESQFSLYKKSQSYKILDNTLTPIKTHTPISESKTQFSPGNVGLYTSPTANLPNFVIDGRSPHNRTESPSMQKRHTDWLTTLRRKKSLFAGAQRLSKTEEHKNNKTKVTPKNKLLK